VKLVRKVKKEDHRNVFLNLAVPIMQASEPADVQKTKLTASIETTLWDRWTVDAKGLTLKEVMAKVEEQHAGLVVKDVLRGNAPIYFHAIMSAPGREKDREKALNTPLAELLEAQMSHTNEELDQYVDLTITCSAKGDEAGGIIAGVPILRASLV